MDKNEQHEVTAACQRKATGKCRKPFSRSEDGAAAIEFAVVAPVFLMMVFGIFELGLNYVADRSLNAGLEASARKIRTGEIRANQGMATFKQDLCSQAIMFLIDCDDIIIDVQEIAEFDEQSYDTDDDGKVITEDFGFAPGGPSTINVVRVFVEWPTVINWTSFGQAHGYEIDAFKDGSRIIFSSNAFMNEPFAG